MPKQLTTELYTIPAIGATKSFSVNKNIDIYEIKATGGAVLLSGSMVFSPTGTAKRGMLFIFDYHGGVTSNTGSGIVVTFFGINLTDEQALYKTRIECYYDGSAWNVIILPTLNYAATSKFETNNYKDSSVTNAKLAGSIALNKFLALPARGYLSRAGAAGAWESFDAKTAAYFVAGDGTDVKSMPVIGPVTFTHSGGNLVSSIGNGQVTSEMLAFSLNGQYLETTLTIATADVLTLNATPIEIIGSPGAGKAIEIITAISSLTYVSAAYAANTTLQLITDTASIAQLQDTAILISTISKNTKFQQVTAATAAQTQIIADKGIMLKVATGNPTTGDSNITVRVLYRIIEL